MNDASDHVDAMGERPIVYIREVAAETLRAEGALPPGAALPPGLKLYALHLEDGRRIAVVDGRDSAFAAALQNDFAPVSVH